MRESAMRDLCDNIRMHNVIAQPFLEMVVGWRCHLPLTTTQFRQTLLPNTPKLNFDLQPLHEILTLRRL
jgi:hypothetical protein